MKTTKFLVLFILLSSFLVTSCKKEECDCNDNCDIEEIDEISELKVTIDGTPYVFNAVVITDYFVADYDGETLRKITATIDGTTDKVISFSVRKDMVGTGSIRYFKYILDGVTYQNHYGGSLTFFVTQNDEVAVKGTFSANMVNAYDDDDDTIIVFTEGSVEKTIE